jgi:hypothetical protein
MEKKYGGGIGGEIDKNVDWSWDMLNALSEEIHCGSPNLIANALGTLADALPQHKDIALFVAAATNSSQRHLKNLS